MIDIVIGIIDLAILIVLIDDVYGFSELTKLSARRWRRFWRKTDRYLKGRQ